MEVAAWREIQDAVLAARPHTAPALVALHQATATIVQVKLGWRFTLARELPLSQEAQEVRAEVMKACDEVFTRLLGPDADIVWARQVYLALLGEAAHSAPPGTDPDALAAKVIDTLMHGVAGR
jgi:hypothetical protein